MFKFLPIIPSSTSRKIYPLFFFYSHIKAYFPILFFSLAVEVSIYHFQVYLHHLVNLKALIIRVFHQYHSLNDLTVYHCLHLLNI